MTVPARISLITLAVDDVARATAFYESLGWTAASVVEDEVAFFTTTSGPVLSLYRSDFLSRDVGVAARGPHDHSAVTLAMNVHDAAEVDRVLAEAAAAGASNVKPGAPTHWGGYVGYFADPDGHVWEVAHNPGFQLNEDGTVTLP